MHGHNEPHSGQYDFFANIFGHSFLSMEYGLPINIFQISYKVFVTALSQRSSLGCAFYKGSVLKLILVILNYVLVKCCFTFLKDFSFTAKNVVSSSFVSWFMIEIFAFFCIKSCQKIVMFFKHWRVFPRRFGHLKLIFSFFFQAHFVLPSFRTFLQR